MSARNRNDDHDVLPERSKIRSAVWLSHGKVPGRAQERRYAADKHVMKKEGRGTPFRSCLFGRKAVPKTLKRAVSGRWHGAFEHEAEGSFGWGAGRGQRFLAYTRVPRRFQRFKRFLPGVLLVIKERQAGAAVRPADDAKLRTAVATQRGPSASAHYSTPGNSRWRGLICPINPCRRDQVR